MSDNAQNTQNAQKTPHKLSHAQSVERQQADYYTRPFYALNGRIGRLRYIAYGLLLTLGLYLTVALLLFIVASILILTVDESSTWAAGVPTLFSNIILLTLTLGPMLAYMLLARRRLHDINRSGWIALLFILPLINALFWLYLVFVPGDLGRNRYGLPAAPPSLLIKSLACLAILLILFGFVGSIRLMLS